MNFLALLSNQLLLTVLGGFGTVATGCWAVYTYFDQRKLKLREQKKDADIHPDQLIEIIKILALQSQDDCSALQSSGVRGRPTTQRIVSLTTVSRFLSRILRHDPVAAAIHLDDLGWADVDILIKGVNAAGYRLSVDDLESVVRTSLGKRGEPRFSLSTDKRRIRANWGRSA